MRMSEAVRHAGLETLLQHPALWRATRCRSRRGRQRLCRARCRAAGRRLAAPRPGRNPDAGSGIGELACGHHWSPRSRSRNRPLVRLSPPPFEPFAGLAVARRTPRAAAGHAWRTGRLGPRAEPAVGRLWLGLRLAAARHHDRAAAAVAGDRTQRLARRADPAAARRASTHGGGAAHRAHPHRHASASAAAQGARVRRASSSWRHGHAAATAPQQPRARVRGTATGESCRRGCATFRGQRRPPHCLLRRASCGLPCSSSRAAIPHSPASAMRTAANSSTRARAASRHA